MEYQIHQNGATILNEITLKVSSAWSIVIGDSWHGENVVSPFSRLYYLRNGSGKIVVRGSEIILRPNHVYLIPVGLKFSHYPMGEMEKIYFHFNITKADGYDLLRGINNVKALAVSHDYIEEIYHLFNSPKLSDAFTLKTRLLDDIAKMASDEKESIAEPHSYSEKIYKAVKIITTTPTIRLTTAGIAKELFISESLLSKTFKKEVGMTIGDYIDRMVMYGAQTALIETKDSISSIADRFGFNDRYYFSKRFKLLFGETPSEYRKRLKIYDS